MNILVDLMKETAARRQTVFKTATGEVHDRTRTVGASESFGCLRKTYFSKTEAPKDENTGHAWGFFERGNTMESWTTALATDALPAGAQLLYIDDNQVTLIDGNVSATPDGLLIMPDGEEIAVEVKSLDPRSNLNVPKPAHINQINMQMGLFNKLTEHKPERGILIYVNASDYSEIVEHEIEYDPGIIENAHKRAGQVYTASSGADLPAEGAYADECRYCDYTGVCGGSVAAHYPSGKPLELDAEIEAELDELIHTRAIADVDMKDLKVIKGEADERIKVLLRQHNIKNAHADHWNVNYSPIRGRVSLDQGAMEEAGIDLEPYRKRGKDSERLTIKLTA